MIKIALVDDDRATNFLNSHLIKSILSEIEISLFANGKELLESNDLHLFKYIFLDINMPVMNGIEFLEKYSLLEVSNETKVFVAMPDLSNYNTEQLKTKFSVVESFYSKPLTSNEILTFLPNYAR